MKKFTETEPKEGQPIAIEMDEQMIVGIFGYIDNERAFIPNETTRPMYGDKVLNGRWQEAAPVTNNQSPWSDERDY